MMRINFLLLLISFFTQIDVFQADFANNSQCLVEYPPKECCIDATKKLQSFMNISGVLTFSKHKFVFSPTLDLIEFIKQIIRSGESEILRNMSPEDVDGIFEELSESEVDVLQKYLTILVVEAEASGPNLLTSGGLDWQFVNSEILSSPSGTIRLNEEAKPILESKIGGLRFEFNLGPVGWFATRVDEKFCSDFGITGKCTVIVGLPTLEVEKNGQHERLTYMIYMYYAMNAEDDNEYEEYANEYGMDDNEYVSVTRRNWKNTEDDEDEGGKIFLLIRAVTEVLMHRLQNMKMQDQIGLPFRYFLKNEVIHMQDANSFFYIRRWVQPSDCSNVIINLHELMMAYLKDSHVTDIHLDVLHSPKKFRHGGDLKYQFLPGETPTDHEDIEYRQRHRRHRPLNAPPYPIPPGGGWLNAPPYPIPPGGGWFSGSEDAGVLVSHPDNPPPPYPIPPRGGRLYSNNKGKNVNCRPRNL